MTEQIEDLVEGLSSRSPVLRLRAKASLTTLLDDEDDGVRLSVVGGLACIGQGLMAIAVMAMGNALAERKTVVEALDRIDPATAAAVELLDKARHDRDLKVVAAAAEALALLSSSATAVARALTALDDPDARWVAAEAPSNDAASGFANTLRRIDKILAHKDANKRRALHHDLAALILGCFLAALLWWFTLQSLRR